MGGGKGGTYLSDRKGHGHKAVVCKSHFPPLRHFSCTETPTDTLANKPRLTKGIALCSLWPTTLSSPYRGGTPSSPDGGGGTPSSP